MKKSETKKYQFVPELISASQLQRKSGKIIDMVCENLQPYFIVRNNKPTAVLINIEEYEKLKGIQKEWEWRDTVEAIVVAENEKKRGKLKKLKSSVYDLWKELQKVDK
jgi:prevent-host-death family protein